MKIVTHSELGPRISSRLADLKKNQVWLAERMGLSNEAISKWINGKTDPKLSNLRKVSGLLKCSVGYLAGDEQDSSIAEAVRIMESLQAAPTFTEPPCGGFFSPRIQLLVDTQNQPMVEYRCGQTKSKGDRNEPMRSIRRPESLLPAAGSLAA